MPFYKINVSISTHIVFFVCTLYICICIYIYVCMYIFIYLHTYICVYMYVNTCGVQCGGVQMTLF